MHEYGSQHQMSLTHLYVNNVMGGDVTSKCDRQRFASWRRTWWDTRR